VQTPDELLLFQKMIYDPCGYRLTDLVIEPEGVVYQACEFKLNKIFVKFRKSKVTPAKVGQFVTLWKRIKNGAIAPFDFIDPIDLFIISVRDENKLGQFIFTKAVLLKHGILSQNKKGGKRAMRVYPPWVLTANDQAKKTQAWQVEHFLIIPSRKPIDLVQAKKFINQ
jgi:hypothetical protein